jgi:hypothetical protein
VYAADAAPLALGQPYVLTGDGGGEVGPLAAQVLAPPAFPELTAAREPSGDVALAWQPLDESFEPVLVEVKAGARGARCRVRDTGTFHVARELVPAGAATVTATRVARAPLLAPGAGRGELVLSLRDVQVLP